MIATSLMAQTSGEIIYTTTINIHAQLRGPRAEQMKQMLPETQSFQQILQFTDTETLFQKYENEEVVDEVEIDDQRARRFMMRMMGAGDGDLYYTNLEEERVVQQRDFLGKMFLIDDEFEELQWKFTGEQKTIKGYVCQKAELVIPEDTTNARPPQKEGDNKDENAQGDRGDRNNRGGRGSRGFRGPKSVVAWFTPQIPVAAGPMQYAQLPGMVLRLEIDGNSNVITAETITLKELADDAIEVPKKGKKVTREEFKTIVQEKIEEMRKERGGRGGGRMIIRNEK